MSEFIVEAQSLSKDFRSFQSERSIVRMLGRPGKQSSCRNRVLNDLSFKIERSEKIALLGRNGAGKTTLLRLLSGIYKPSAGHIKVTDRPAVFLRFWIGAARELSVLEALRLLAAIYGVKPPFTNTLAESILDLSELSALRHSPVKVLSSGQYQRLTLAVFFHVDSSFVIFDEGLAYLDTHFIKKFERYFSILAASPATVILTSHDTDFLRKFCTSALWLDQGTIRMQGPISVVLPEYERENTPPDSDIYQPSNR